MLISIGMTSGLYKFDDGQSCPTNCFPAGTLQQRSKEGAGHWLVAYRKAEKQRYRKVERRIKETYRIEENSFADTPHGITLNRFFLLQLHCVDEPSELCSADISEQKLNSVEPEDLKVFDNIAHINASINSLSLGSFSSFVSLRELSLSLNGIRNMTFDATDFPYLEVLDLSYNSLSAEAIVSLGQLPHLKVLHLTGNKLHRLPPNLGSSNRDPTQMSAKDEDTQFNTLEVLTLDDNKLSSGVFNSLTNLKRLKHLNLQKNRISEIPFMQAVGRSKPETEEQAEEQGRDHTESSPNTDEHLRNISQIIPKHSWEERCKGSSLPLPELQFLNLAENKISEEEALMAAALFPKLCEIDIHSNPLTTRRRGDPPLLTYYLQERLGITIKRKTTQEAVKLPLKGFTDVKWKMEEKIPKVSNKSLLMNTARPAQSRAEKSQATVKRTARTEGKNSKGLTFHENTEHFFITQAADVPEFKWDLPPEERNNLVSQQLPCNELLMDAEPHPDALKPAGIHTAVRMLEHALKNLNVYRDSKPRLDSIQTPYREREKRIKDLPPLKPIKQPTERVDEMIKSMKESTTVKVVALGSAMQSTHVNRKEYKEALSLLTDMKTKYKMVHKKTMEQVGSDESEGNMDQNGAEPPHGQKL
ncbi:X-ray radiation resistance-associated protein 1 isoform X2 [Acanthochromis polyacanthus]|uniref:X-ray radiation resistance-associated protein 1 isoform X2 n=1 Tax=Acanthochromis polyacanthus TaxID=80966 RepID=UPI002233F8C7|nr:X-ray radiation resistance-associated protein 1 isoform X2 [Acanthochromis polyacanthus]